MIYTEIKPHVLLKNYIAAIWTVEGEGRTLEKQSILPDGCVDLIFNLGEDCKTENGSLIMKTGKSYLVGTMTSPSESILSSSNKLIGVRFQPAGFSSFYNYSSLEEMTDKMQEFDPFLTPDISQIEQKPTSFLNSHYLNRLTPEKHNLIKIMQEVQACHGQISIETLSKRNYTTSKQLERSFKRYIGIGPKEFANILRFRAALYKIKNSKHRKNLLDIAYECGYYDHAHLTKDIKRYSGLTPSQF